MKKLLSELTMDELWTLFPIILKDHNPQYIEWYEIEKQALQNGLNKSDIARINHIGSSAVSGLVAKPTIDILLELDGCCNVEQVIEQIKSLGWILMSQEQNPFRLIFNKGYTPDGFAKKVYHLHVRYLGDWGELYFRDYLKLHAEAAREYGELKLSLWKKYEHNRDGYTQAKHDFISFYTEKARIEFDKKYKPGLEKINE